MPEIKFIPAEVESVPTYFKDVKSGQFFVDKDGYFCQKSFGGAYGAYTKIANGGGEPSGALVSSVSENMRIKSILPKIAKITF